MDDKKNRKDLRLDGFNYSSCEAYFVTICVQSMLHLFAKVVDECLVLNEAGEMIARVWGKILENYHGINLGEFVVMPNHVHGIVLLLDTPNVGEGPRALPGNVECVTNNDPPGKHAW